MVPKNKRLVDWRQNFRNIGRAVRHPHIIPRLISRALLRLSLLTLTKRTIWVYLNIEVEAATHSESRSCTSLNAMTRRTTLVVKALSGVNFRIHDGHLVRNVQSLLLS